MHILFCIIIYRAQKARYKKTESTRLIRLQFSGHHPHETHTTILNQSINLIPDQGAYPITEGKSIPTPMHLESILALCFPHRQKEAKMSTEPGHGVLAIVNMLATHSA